MSDLQTKVQEEEHTSSSEEEEEVLPPLPPSRPASVRSLPSSSKSVARPQTPDLKKKSYKVEKPQRKDQSLADKFKKVLLEERTPTLSRTSTQVATPQEKKETNMSEVRGIKPKNPDTYLGGIKDLERFLSQCQVYFLLRRTDFKNHAEKVLFAGSHLRGLAADLFTPFIRDFAKGEQASRETKEMFRDYAYFEKSLEQLYGSRHKQRVSVRQLQQLKQLTPTFRRLAMDSGWNDAALITHYYGGLKDKIKDELARSDRPDSLNELIDRVLTIDERFFEGQMERGGPNGWQPDYRPPRPQHQGPDPMDLSATRGPLSKQDRG